MRSWRVDLLLILTVVLGPTVGVLSQQSYHAEEHGNITLTCSFPAGTNMSLDLLQISVKMVEPLRNIYWCDSRLKNESYTDEFYRGRLHCDPQLNTSEPIQFVLTDLRLNDTGTYWCVVVADGKKKRETFELVVTASRNETVKKTPPREPTPRERLWLCVSLGVFLVVVVVVVVLVVRYVIVNRKSDLSRIRNNNYLIGKKLWPFRHPVSIDDF